MIEKQQDLFPAYLNVEYKKVYARDFTCGQLRHINNSEAYLSTPSIPSKNPISRDSKKALKSQDKISIVLVLGERKRILQASVLSTDSRGARVKFHFLNNRDYQIIDDLIYFVEKAKESRRKKLHFIFDQTL